MEKDTATVTLKIISPDKVSQNHMIIMAADLGIKAILGYTSIGLIPAGYQSTLIFTTKEPKGE